MKKYIWVGFILIALATVFYSSTHKAPEKVFYQDETTGQNIGTVQEPVLYEYPKEIWEKVPLQNSKLDLYSAGETYDGTTLLGSVVFPEKLVKKEFASLIGERKCPDYRGDEEPVVCNAGLFKGIAITSYPDAYEALVKKFNDEVCRYGDCSRSINIGARAGTVFTNQFELEGRNYYLLPLASGKTLVAKVDFNWNEPTETKFMEAQVELILSSGKLQ